MMARTSFRLPEKLRHRLEEHVLELKRTDPKATRDGFLREHFEAFFAEDRRKIRDIIAYLRSPGYATGTSNPEAQGKWLADALEEALAVDAAEDGGILFPVSPGDVEHLRLSGERFEGRLDGVLGEEEAQLALQISDAIRTPGDLRRLLDRVAVELDRDGEIALPGGGYASGATQGEIDADREVAAAIREMLGWEPIDGEPEAGDVVRRQAGHRVFRKEEKLWVEVEDGGLMDVREGWDGWERRR